MRGFTLVELLVAITILGIVFGVVVTSASSIQKASRDAQRRSDLRSLQSALQQFYADQQYYPDKVNLSSGGSLTSCSGNPACSSNIKTYLLEIPKDPASQDYQYISLFDVNVNPADATKRCDYSASATKCHYYLLCAKLESPSTEDNSSSSACQSAFGPTYNLKTSPL